MNKLGCVIIDWKRPGNMPTVLEGIRSQSIDTDIYVIHQENTRIYEGCENFHSERNRGPGARWLMLPFIQNEYCVFVDDDLKLKDERILETMLRECVQHHHVSCVGVILGSPEAPYTTCRKLYAQDPPVQVDIGMGNLNMVKAQPAASLIVQDLALFHSIAKDGIIAEDDILFSYLHQKAGGATYCCGNGSIPYDVLDVAHGLEHRPTHYTDRNEICIRLYPSKTT